MPLLPQTGSHFELRFIRDYQELEKIVEALKALGAKIVLTSGTWDMLHIGHCLYLEKARELGDILIVGVDSDEKVKLRKGPSRPLESDANRLPILAHVRHVDYVFLKKSEDQPRLFIKTVRPAVLVLSERTKRTDEEIAELKGYCSQLVILQTQAATSTTAKIRRLLVEQLGEEIKKDLKVIIEKIDKLIGGV